MGKRRRERTVVDTAVEAGADRKTAAAKALARSGWRRFPVWGWALIFVVPLILSEFMFARAGRTLNMALFPIVWAGFWAVLWYRSVRQMKEDSQHG